MNDLTDHLARQAVTIERIAEGIADVAGGGAIPDELEDTKDTMIDAALTALSLAHLHPSPENEAHADTIAAALLRLQDDGLIYVEWLGALRH